MSGLGCEYLCFTYFKCKMTYKTVNLCCRASMQCSRPFALLVRPEQLIKLLRVIDCNLVCGSLGLPAWPAMEEHNSMMAWTIYGDSKWTFRVCILNILVHNARQLFILFNWVSVRNNYGLKL